MASRISPYVDNTGLVFAYDLANIKRSYLGEPATNLAVSTWSSWGVDASGYSTVGTRTILSPYHVRIDDISSNTRQSFAFYSGFNASTTYNFSVKFKKITGAPTLRFQIYSYVSGNFTNVAFPTTVQLGLTDKEGWQTASYSYTSAAGSTGLFWYIQDGDDYTAYTHSFELKEIQLEVNSHATPFVVGTRSVTQGLKDLTGKSTIDLTNVSFDANAQMTFDGTDDTISVNSYSAIELVDNVSIEYVYMRLSTDPILDVIANKYHSTGWELFCQTGNTFALAGRNGDGTYYATSNAAYTIQNNKYYHLVAIKEGLSWRLYVNGELYASLTAGSIGTWSNNGILQIGGEGGGYFPNMKLPVFKIYNRVLTASEIQQNFNAIKGRYGL